MRVGVLGCGNVGAPLVELIARPRRATVAARTGLRLEVTRVAVRDLAKPRPISLPADRLTDDAGSIVDDPDIDLVVEVIGGIEPARDLILAALKAGKPVVTGNKELLANHGAELFEAAERAGVDLLFEAAVAGGIPLIRPLRESLVGERITRVMGIVNGTTNYILTRMTEAGVVLRRRPGRGAGARLRRGRPHRRRRGLRRRRQGRHHRQHRVRRRPSPPATSTTRASPASPRSTSPSPGGWATSSSSSPSPSRPTPAQIGVRVHPAMVPVEHPLASVRESFNAVFVEGAAVGDLMFYGRGAGGSPTASAILGDLIDAAVNRHKGSHASVGQLSQGRASGPIDDVESAYYLNLEVLDRPGVLAQVAGVFGDHGVSIRSMEQEGLGDEARLIFITHRAREPTCRPPSPPSARSRPSTASARCSASSATT